MLIQRHFEPPQPLQEAAQQLLVQQPLRDFGVDKICKAQIPVDVNVAKAVDSFMPVSLLSPNTAGSKAFMQLTQELLQKL